MKIRIRSFVSAVVMVILVSGLAYGIWLASQAIFEGNVLGTVQMSGTVEGSLDGVTYSQELPMMFNSADVAPGDDITVDFWLRKVDGATEPTGLNVQVTDSVITEGEGQGAVDTGNILKMYEISNFRAGPYTLHTEITDIDGDGVKTLFDLTSPSQEVSWEGGSWTITLSFNDSPADEYHGDSVGFNIALEGL